MSINGIGTAAYLAAGHRTGRTESNTASGAKGFMETVAEKTAQDKEAEWNEKAFDLAGAKAPQSVKDAWMETVKEVGVNGLGMTSNGMTHITELHIQQVIANYWGYSTDILGDSVQSAMRAAQKALYDFDHPLEPGKVRSMEEQRARVKERQFYVTFLEKLGKLTGAGEVGTGTVSGMRFKGMWKTRFPGAYYHVMDGSKISQGAWDRNDFPFERFFSDHVDESILNWTPSGAEPSANSSEVQSRWSATAGKKAVIVPPALEQKMQDNPGLAEKVMAAVENFINTYPATPGCSYLIELDENGEISKYRVTSPGRITVSSSEFVEARKAREAKHEEYERLAEESALKRKMLAQEMDRRFYQSRAVSAVAYEQNIMEASGILK